MVYKNCKTTHTFKFALGYSTYTISTKICISWLNTPKTTKIFIPRLKIKTGNISYIKSLYRKYFFPFSNEVFVSIAFIQTKLVQL